MTASIPSFLRFCAIVCAFSMRFLATSYAGSSLHPVSSWPYSQSDMRKASERSSSCGRRRKRYSPPRKQPSSLGGMISSSGRRSCFRVGKENLAFLPEEVDRLLEEEDLFLAEERILFYITAQIFCGERIFSRGRGSSSRSRRRRYCSRDWDRRGFSRANTPTSALILSCTVNVAA